MALIGSEILTFYKQTDTQDIQTVAQKITCVCRVELQERERLVYILGLGEVKTLSVPRALRLGQARGPSAERDD